MNRNSRFRINDPNIVTDTFGDEAVLVNLDSGIYYSLRESASQIWFRIINGYSADEIIQEFIELYDADKTDIEILVEKFIAELVENNLILISDSESVKKMALNFDTPKLNLHIPILETYSDMQEILLLDPVHDVDKEGWPVSKDKNK